MLHSIESVLLNTTALNKAQLLKAAGPEVM